MPLHPDGLGKFDLVLSFIGGGAGRSAIRAWRRECGPAPKSTRAQNELWIEWPEGIAETQAMTDLPVWVSEVGLSSFRGVRVAPKGRAFNWSRAVPTLVFPFAIYRAPGRPRPATAKRKEEFEVTLTFCFTPEHHGILPHYTSRPLVLGEFAEFCARITPRCAPVPSEHRSSQRLGSEIGGWETVAPC